MKFGMRTPSLKKSVKARTTGKIKRSIKKALILGYGKRGMGWIKNPKKAAYNKVYHKTSFSLFDLFKYPNCDSVSDMKEKNKVFFYGTRDICYNY